MKWVKHLRFIRHFISMRTVRGLGLIWGYWFGHLLINPLSHLQHVYNGWLAKHKGLFWCTSKVAKEKNTTFSRKHFGEREENYMTTQQDTFPWVVLVHNVNQDVMDCSISYVEGIPPLQIYKVFLYIGCGSGGKYCINSLVHHHASKEHYCCSLQFEKDSDPAYLYVLWILL